METIPEFEYDPSKSLANLGKHEIDFERAQQLWQDDRYVEGPTVSEDEDRWMRVAILDNKLWAAIYTVRDGRIRLISVRRARTLEAAQYERQTHLR